MRFFVRLISVGTLIFLPTVASALEYKDIGSICKDAVSNVTDVRVSYTEHLLESNSIPSGFLESNNMMKPFIAHCEKSSDKKSCGSLNKVTNNIRGLVTSGGHEIGDSGLKFSDPITTVDAEFLYSFLFSKSQNYKVICTKGLPDSEKGEKTDGVKFNIKSLSITKDNSTVLKTIDSKKEFAELGVKLDRGAKTKITNADGTETLKNNDVFSANFSIALRDFIQFNSKESKFPGPSISPFVSLAYESAFDPNKEKDELSAGIIWTQYFRDSTPDESKAPPNFQFELDRVLLEGSYITDIEERQSQQWAAQATLPFFVYDGSESKENGFSVPFIFAADLVVDYWDIARAGDKVALAKLVDEQGAKTITRLGYDLRLNADLVQSNFWSLSFDTKYQFRDATRTGGLGDANRLEVGLGFTPQQKSGEDSNFSFGLTYERGESLKSLLEEELWKLSFKYKQ